MEILSFSASGSGQMGKSLGIENVCTFGLIEVVGPVRHWRGGTE